MPQSVVIVGGGIAGVSTAAALRGGGFDGLITLVDPADLPYDRPPLSKEYLSGARDMKEIALQPREWYDEQHIELRTATRVEAIELGDGSPRVRLDDGSTLAADRLVLATGGDAWMPPVPGLEQVRDAGRVHVLRDVEHADGLRAALQTGVRLLVVGGGLIGAEVASTAAMLGCDVTLVDPLDPPLPAAGSATARWLHDEHARRRVSTVHGALAALDLVGDVVRARFDDGTSVEFDQVLVGVGMVPRTDLAAAAGLQIDRGVLVDDGQVTSHPAVLAVGDAAQRRGARPAEHWEAAQLDGKRAAASVLGTAAPAATAGWWWSDRHEAHVEGVGAMYEADDEHMVVVRGTLGSPPFSVFTLRGDRVLGAVAVDDSQAVRAARRLIDRGISVSADRLADPATDLRKLLRG